MDLRDSGFIDIPEGIFYGQNDRTNELNWRINDRLNVNTPMKPNYDPRPVTTKYSLFPIIDRVKPITEPINTFVDYNIENNFIPCTNKPHYSGFFNNIDKESTLRSQDRILTKYETHGEYTPSFESDLYKVSVPKSQPLLDQTNAHAPLFEKYTFKSKNFDTAVGNDKFNNATRTQLRNMNA